MAEQKQHRDPTDEDTDLRETGDLEGSPGREFPLASLVVPIADTTKAKAKYATMSH